MDNFKVKVEQVEKALTLLEKKDWRSTYYRSRRKLILSLAKEGASYREIIQYFKNSGLSAPSSATIARTIKKQKSIQQEVKIIPVTTDALHRNNEKIPNRPKPQHDPCLIKIPPLPPPPSSPQPFVFREGIDDQLPEEILHYVRLGQKIPDEICRKYGV